MQTLWDFKGFIYTAEEQMRFINLTVLHSTLSTMVRYTKQNDFLTLCFA